MSAPHARLGASSAHRWLACPGSVAACESVTPGASSIFANEGTAAHELAEIVLNGGASSAFEYEGKALPDNNAHTVDREMAANVQEYVDYVRSIGGEQSYEQRVYFDRWVPDGFGTADAIALKGKTLYVIDLKYGKGVRVDAAENPQGMLYALGALAELDGVSEIDRVVIAIAQPRLDHIDEWVTTPAHLYEWAQWVKARAALADRPDAERVPGETQCRFCDAKATCPALYEHTQKVIALEFEEIEANTVPAPATMSDEQLKTALDNKKLITSWLEAVEDHVKTRFDEGHPLPGYKIVAGRSVRRWRDEDETAKALTTELGDDAYSKKLISPTQAEKLIGKARMGKEFSELVEKPDGAPTLVPESDKRPAIGAHALFDDET